MNDFFKDRSGFEFFYLSMPRKSGARPADDASSCHGTPAKKHYQGEAGEIPKKQLLGSVLGL
jgi:hypothetical protein